MKNLSLAVATILSVTTMLSAEQTLPNGWTLSGNWRTAYISDDGDSYKKSGEIHDFATGGWVTLNTPEVNKFKAGITLHTVQPLLGQNNNGWLTDNKEGQEFTSYSYISEAYLTGTVFGKTSVILGRKIIDTPFANPDDIGMTPNSFEVYLVQNQDIENVTLTAGRVTKMSGQDASPRGEFSDLTSGDGVSVVAANYANEASGLTGQLWHYNLNNFSDAIDVRIIYGDLGFSKEISAGNTLTVGGQFANYKMRDGSTDDGSVFGLKSQFAFGSAKIGIAYNGANGDFTPDNGFGGGPFYTSSDVKTISAVAKDSSALQFSADYQINDKTALSTKFTTFTPDEGDDLTELDVKVSYAHTDNLSLDLYFENYKAFQSDDNMSAGTDDNTEFSLFVNYKF